MFSRGFLSVVVFLAAVASCDVPTSSEDPGLTTTSSPIIGGKATAACEWPMTVLVGGDCSGTLVHPRIVMTAKHCLTRTPASVTFGESRNQVTKTVKVATCYKNPQSDFGFCKLAEDVMDIPVMPVMSLCELALIKPGTVVVEAGFGDQTGAQTGFGTKKWIQGTVVRADPTRTTVTVTAGTQDGEYFGDSGGPVFARMPDGTWRLLGNDWTSPDWNNSGTPRVSTYTSVPFHVAWAEQQAAVDLTPCHDGNKWSPGPDCKGFPTNPGQAAGTWATSCAGQAMVVSPTCNGPDGGTINDGSVSDGSGPPNDGGSDVRTDSAAADATVEAGKDVAGPAEAGSGSGGSGGTTGSGGSGGATVDAKAPVPADAAADGAANVPGTSNHTDAGCSCESAGRGSLPNVASLAALLGFIAVLRRRPRAERRSRHQLRRR